MFHIIWILLTDKKGVEIHDKFITLRSPKGHSCEINMDLFATHKSFIYPAENHNTCNSFPMDLVLGTSLAQATREMALGVSK